MPRTSINGDYRLRVEGNDNGLVGGTAFVNETQLTFSGRSMTIFIQTDKPVYMQGQTGKLLKSRIKLLVMSVVVLRVKILLHFKLYTTFK